MTATALRRHRPCRCPCLCTWRRCPTAGAAAWPPACCLHLTSQCSVPKRQKPFGVGGYNPSTVVSQGESARDIVKKGQERGLTIWAPCLFERFREERTRAGGRQRLRVRGLPLGCWDGVCRTLLCPRRESLVSTSVLRRALVPLNEEGRYAKRTRSLDERRELPEPVRRDGTLTKRNKLRARRHAYKGFFPPF